VTTDTSPPTARVRLSLEVDGDTWPWIDDVPLDVVQDLT
jgi:hypothetical protein